MAKKIAITNQKGGVGKTTLALNLADGLLTIGYRVLFIDLDPQANSTSVYLGQSQEMAEYTLFDLFEGKCGVEDAIHHCAFGDIICSDQRLSEKDAVYQVQIGGTKALKKALKKIEDKYDFVIMDTPPNFGAYMRNALNAADGCIIPVKAEVFAMDGLALLLENINRIRENDNEELKIYGVVLANYDMRQTLDKTVKTELPGFGEKLNFPVFQTAIRICQDIKKAQTMRTSLFRTFGSSNGAMDYAYFVKELLEVLENG